MPPLYVQGQTCSHTGRRTNRDGAPGVQRPASPAAVPALHLVCLLADRQGAGDLSSAAAVDHAVVADEVPDDTQSVMKGSLGLLDDLGKRFRGGQCDCDLTIQSPILCTWFNLSACWSWKRPGPAPGGRLAKNKRREHRRNTAHPRMVPTFVLLFLGCSCFNNRERQPGTHFQDSRPSQGAGQNKTGKESLTMSLIHHDALASTPGARRQRQRLGIGFPFPLKGLKKGSVPHRPESGTVSRGLTTGHVTASPKKTTFSFLRKLPQLTPCAKSQTTFQHQQRTELSSHHLVSSSDEDGDGSGVLTLLDDQHLVLGRPERDLLHQPREAQLLRRELREPRHDAPPGGDGDQLTVGRGGSGLLSLSKPARKRAQPDPRSLFTRTAGPPELLAHPNQSPAPKPC